jgi:hypothetical protein
MVGGLVRDMGKSFWPNGATPTSCLLPSYFPLLDSLFSILPSPCPLSNSTGWPSSQLNHPTSHVLLNTACRRLVPVIREDLLGVHPTKAWMWSSLTPAKRGEKEQLLACLGSTQQQVASRSSTNFFRWKD